LRKANLEDKPDLLRLDNLVFGDASYSASSWEDALRNPAVLIYISEDLKGKKQQNGLTGFVYALYADNTLEIVKVGVEPASRRKHIGTQLIRHACKESNAQKCLVDVSEKNKAALEFYYTLGFTFLMRRKKYYADGSDAEVLEHTCKVIK